MELRDELIIRYRNHSNEELVRIIDLADYTEEAKSVAKSVLEERNVLPAAMHKLAYELWESYCQDHFRDIITKQYKIQSRYLTDDDVKKIIQDTYEYHNERQELFEIDLTKYWGAAFI